MLPEESERESPIGTRVLSSCDQWRQIPKKYITYPEGDDHNKSQTNVSCH